MFEDEYVILPDDFEMPTETETVEDTTPTEQVEVETETQESQEPITEQTPFLKVKYNKEEMELDEERARELAQKGLNYDKVQERLQQLETDPRLSFVEELAAQFGMDVPTYLEAVKQQQEEAKLNELLQQNIPEEYAREMLENRKFRQQLESERQTKAQEEKQNADYNEFFNYFKEANGRDFNSQSDQIPESVWQATQNGVPLKFAYMQHENNLLRQQLQTQKQNQTNKQKAPVGSVTAHGSNEVASEDDFLAGFDSI
jgi:hypothetical protein